MNGANVKRRKPKRSTMEHIDIRASPESIAIWRARAEASHMTFSEWIRHGLDGTPAYTKPDPIPVTDDDEAP